jgi:3'-phosphoadenosine 5'-phosphosulfate sulfotransferase (PAPS reductase)/FAD synthetase
MLCSDRKNNVSNLFGKRFKRFDRKVRTFCPKGSNLPILGTMNPPTKLSKMWPLMSRFLLENDSFMNRANVPTIKTKKTMIKEELQKKIDRSIRLLQSVGKRYDGVIEIAYSGGKDSDVILQLAREAGIRHEAIYKNTTIDPPGTIAHAREMGATMIRPKDTFFHLVAKKGLPSRFRRFCCEILKEYKIYDKSVIGVRRAESTARSERYHEPTECRWFGAKTEKNHVEQIYPILDWTDADVLSFIRDRHIRLAPIYYDRGGGDRCYA